MLIYIFVLKFTKIKKLIVISSIIIGISCILILTWILNIKTLSSSSVGFVWEILSIIQGMEPERQEKYLDYLDEIGGSGSTLIGLQHSHRESVNGFIWDVGLNHNNMSINKHPQLILSKYINIIFKEPQLYFKIKFDFIKRTLGINKPLPVLEYDYNRNNFMQNFNFNDSNLRKLFVDSYLKINKIFGFFTCRPWVVFLLSIILVIIKWKQKDVNKNFYLFILIVSIFYYGAYLINNQSFEIRYFYSSLYLCMILDLAIVCDLIYDTYVIIKMKYKEKNKLIS